MKLTINILGKCAFYLSFFLLISCTKKINVGFQVDSQTVNENAGTVTVPVVLSRSSKMGPKVPNAPTQTTNVSVSVPYTVSGTATNPTHFILDSGIIKIPAGSSSSNLTFPIFADGIYSGDHTVIITLGDPTGAELSQTSVQTITLKETDDAPLVNFVLASKLVSEAVNNTNISLTLANSIPMDATVNYTVSGSATYGVDHTLATGTVTIPAGSTTASITAHIIDDALAESNETLIITLATPVNATLGSQTVHTLTIVDNDNQPTAAFSSASQNVGEAVGSVSATVALTAASGLDITIPYTVTGTAVAPGDHNLVDGNLVITAGQLSADISFQVVDDTLYENNETVIITIGTPDYANLGAQDTHTVTITNNDAQPSVAFTTNTQNVSEGVGNVTVTATLDTLSGLNVTVPYTVAGTANNPADHNLANGNITVIAGSLTGSVTFAVVDDTLYEGSETVIVTMGVPTNASAGATTVQTINISNNDSPPVVTLTAGAQNVGENVGTVNTTATLNVISGLDVIVNVTVTGTSSNPADHDQSSGSITILAGNLTSSITANIVNDTTHESAETLIYTISAPTNATLGATTVQTVTINDDDPIPTVSFSASSQTVSEAVGTVYVIVVLSNATSSNVTVPFTVGGTAASPADHDLANGSIIISANSTLGQQTFNVVNDATTEATETVVLTMGAPVNASSGATTVHTVNITDNDRSFDPKDLGLWLMSDRGVVYDRNLGISEWKDSSAKKKKTPVWDDPDFQPNLLKLTDLFLPIVSFENLSDFKWWKDFWEEEPKGQVYLVSHDFNEYRIDYWDSNLRFEFDSFMKQYKNISELLWFTKIKKTKDPEVDFYLENKYLLKYK